MKNPKLITPSPEYLESFLEACRSFAANDAIKVHAMKDPATFDQWKDTIFQEYEDQRLGRNLPEGYVPGSTFWLVDGGEFIGAGNIRHRLTPGLREYGGHIGYAIRPEKWGMGYGTLQLSLLLKEAAKLGIEQALITCDDDNVGSYRVMEKNGGVYQGTFDIFAEGKQRLSRRYLVPTGLK